jgi:low density lipoprotein-related protein 2
MVEAMARRQARRLFAVSVVVGALAGSLPSPAGAADLLYWGNNNGTSLSFANLDGSGGGDIFSAADGPAGIAIDSVTGRLYYTNEGANTISFLNPDGSPGGNLNTGAATVEAPDGLAIDPASRKIFWANDTIPGAISFAGLDGGGGGDLNTGAATVEGPSGVAIDTATGRLYWANYNDPSISFANLDNSGGGGDLTTAGATLAGPSGVAIDPSSGRIFWADYGAGNRISFARLDGSGGGDLSTSGATVAGPWGVAVDPEAGRVYWANNTGGSLAFARLDGSGGGGSLATGGATVEGPAFPVIQKVPVGSAPPVISGGSKVGATLSCSQGSWATDLFSAHLYRAPSAFAFQWSRDGKDIAGATSGSVAASKAGQYVCRVTGSNRAGAATQSSAPHRVGPPVPPDFDTAIFDSPYLYLRLKCPSRFKPLCVGNAAATTVKDRCTTKKGRRHCKAGTPMTATVSAKQKPNKWHVAKLKVKPKYLSKVAKMAKRPSKKLLIVRQLVHAKKFKGGRAQSVFHIYRVRTATR